VDKSIDKKNRITIFAHFDRDNLVDDYVILYLKGLREVSEKIIFVSDGKIIEEEKFKLSELCSDIIDEKHGEYDFGSHKRGFNFFKEKYSQEFESAKEIIFANDSCTYFQ
jgi:lipopolysaccharide biosynthesis protein